jgi:hypothetical protein
VGYGEQYDDANEARLRQKVTIGLLNTARDALTESGATPKHAERIALAYRVIISPDVWASRFTLTLTAIGSVVIGSTDAAIQTSVGNAWNFYADAVAAGVF